MEQHKFQFKYQDAIDDHNSLCHILPRLDNTLKLHSLPICVFTFLLPVTKVYVYLFLKIIVQQVEDLMKYLDFCCKLAWLIIENEIRRDKKTERHDKIIGE